MSKKRLSLISVRVDPNTLELLDKFCDVHQYWSRNAVINEILSVVMSEFDDKSLWDIVRRRMSPQNPVYANFKIVSLMPKEEQDKE